jgi:hypothetical protein
MSRTISVNVTVHVGEEAYEAEAIAAFSLGRPAVPYLRNGDPGYPAEDAEVEIVKIERIRSADAPRGEWRKPDPIADAAIIAAVESVDESDLMGEVFDQLAYEADEAADDRRESRRDAE